MAKKKEETKPQPQTQELQVVEGGMQTVVNLGLFERLYLEDLMDRIFYLDGNVTSDVLHTIVSQIIKINGMEYGCEDSGKRPIILIINSCGGSVIDGTSVMDVINTSAVPVIGIVTGYAYSMAFDILTQCHYRIGMPNSSYMYHDGWTCESNTSCKTQDTIKFYTKLDERIDKMIANKTKLTTDYLQSIVRAENYWFADEAKERGIIDAVIGEDISIGEVFGFMSECGDCCGEE